MISGFASVPAVCNFSLQVVDTFTEAVATVKAEQSVGRLSVLWIAFARFYEAHDDVKNAAKVYERAVKVPFKTVDDLASVWCESVEMHLRHGLYKEALDLVRRAVNKPRGADTHPSQQRLYRSVKLWALAADVVRRVHYSLTNDWLQNRARFQWS